MNNGWISIHRKFKEWEWYGDSKIVHLFLHCLLKANHKPTKWRGTQIEAGQFITSQSHLAEEMHLSVMQVRTILNKLKSTGELTVKITNKYSIISITNWELYQGDNRLDNTQVTDNQQAANTQVTTNNNNNNNKNENNDNKNPVPAKKKKQQEIVVVEYHSDLLPAAWDKWIAHRRKAKMKKLTPDGEALAMKNLVEISSSKQMQLLIVEQSMAQGWQGLFPLKGNKSTVASDENAAFRESLQANEDAIEGHCYESK